MSYVPVNDVSPLSIPITMSGADGEIHLLQAVEPVGSGVEEPLRILQTLVRVSPFCDPECHILPPVCVSLVLLVPRYDRITLSTDLQLTGYVAIICPT